MVKLRKKTVAAVLAVSLCVSGLGGGQSSSALSALVKKVTLNKGKATLYLGAGKKKASVKLKAKIKPAAAARAYVNWSSSAKKVASVSSKGVVKAKSPGKATITARVGRCRAVCKVTVKRAVKVKKITVSPKEITIKRGTSAFINVNVSPANARNKAVSFKSENKRIASVSKAGTVRGVNPGTTAITVSAKDGSGVSAAVVVKVISNSVKPTPSASPSAEPDPSPSVLPDASAEPTNSPDPSPSATPSASPNAGPTQQIIWVGPAKPPYTPQPTATPTPAPTATPEPLETLVPVEPEKDGSYSLPEDEDFVISDGESSISVDKEMIKQCSDMLEKLGSGVDILSKWETYEEFLKPGDEPLSITRNGCKAVLRNVDGALEAEITMEDGNELTEGSYKIRKADNGMFLVTGKDGIISSAKAMVSGDKYLLTGIEWSDDAPSILRMLGDDAVVDVPRRIISSGTGDKSVDFSSGSPKIIGLPEEMEIYKRVYKK